MRVPDSAGVMILSKAVLFPHAMLPLFIFEPRYRTLLADALDSHRMFCIGMQNPGDSRERPLPIAGLGIVRAAVKNSNGTSNLVLQGIARVRLGRVIRYRPYRLQEIALCAPDEDDTLAVDALRSRLLELVELRLSEGSHASSELFQQIARTGGDPANPVRSCMRALRHMRDTGHLADLMTLLLIDTPIGREVVFQSVDVAQRIRHLIQFLEGDPSFPFAGPADSD